MVTGWQYRVASVAGTAGLTALAVGFANLPVAQDALVALPYAGRQLRTVLSNGDLAIALATAVLVVLAAAWPLFKPHPRRTLATVFLTEKRIAVAVFALATLGYFDYSFRLPRSTLVMTAGALAVLLPGWMVAIQRQPVDRTRALLVGDDPDAMVDLAAAADVPVVGYVAPSSVHTTAQDPRREVADGGVDPGLSHLPHLGGLSRLEEVLLEEEVDTVLLAFAESDRAEFFGTLATCHDYGMAALAHRDHAANVLTSDVHDSEALVEIDVEPWDWLDHVVKRTFDVLFAGVGLLVLSPAIATIAVAIKLDSPGPVLYGQERTAEFGETFTVYKFRSMVPDAEAETGATLSAEGAGGVDPRVTRVGRVLRRTHLDEIPQLWSILVGHMSTVGPRPERPELDDDIEDGVEDWPTRWFVKPGLTGWAQVHDVTGHEPDRKLRYDLEYIREQSFWFDLQIVVRQVWLVVRDVSEMLADSGGEPSEGEE
ncbi:MAG: sugar transferase [Halorientalis sp.]